LVRVIAAAGLLLAAVFHLPGALAQTSDDSGPPVKVEDFAKGANQYDRSCAPCHGRNMVNAGVTIYDLRKFPLDQQDRFLASVTNGKGNMPSFKELSPEQLAWLWAYIRSRGKTPG
jgi:cytochrome c6